MKRITLIVLIALFSLTQLSAQEPSFLKGDKVLNVGIGLGSTLYTGIYYKTTIPPISASLEWGIVDFEEPVLEKAVVGIGPYVGFASYKWEYNYLGANWGYRYTNIIFGARGTFHYPFLDKLDTYTGLLIGANIVSSSEFGNIDPLYNYSQASSGLAWSWFLGARYYFTESLAAMLELGYGISYLNIGIALKL
ncbi:MAG: hypothetical protein JXR52_10505 [Bacteroidales bacterium]|nr:hypothetical protein [Bacteroidales bacterium]